MTAPRRLKKGDFWLIGGLLFVVALLFLWHVCFPAPPGATVRVTVDDQVYGIYPLSVDTEVEIVTPHGHNHLVIQGGAVSIDGADCPQQICAHHRAISRTGDVIVCLPHRVVVTVEGADAAAVDAVT